MGVKGSWFRRRPSDEEMREEQAHDAMRAEHDRVDEAAARRRLGNMLQTRESMRRVWISAPSVDVTDHDHMISPEERFRIAMARPQDVEGRATIMPRRLIVTLSAVFTSCGRAYRWRSAASGLVRAARQAGTIVATITPPSTTARALANDVGPWR
jgi:hypothetical protein